MNSETEKLISKISELNINGYYDASSGYVTIWFHNSLVDKPDVVAYLKSDMSWDVREIVSEESRITSDQEVVVVKHRPLSVELQGETFDLLLRKMIKVLITSEKGKVPPAVAKMREILEANSYGLMVLN